MTLINTLPPKGMRDFYPEEYRVREWLFNHWRDAGLKYGFEMYDTPVVENLSLLVRKAGEEITDQIYYFKDKSDRELALRPEQTPSLARIVLSRENEWTYPLKLSAIVQCFRYEKMSTGRKREHYQWNVDIIGDATQLAEAEVLSTAVESIKEMGLDSTDVGIAVGSRQLIGDLLRSKNIKESDYVNIFLVLDKKGKVSDEVLEEMLTEKGISKEDIDKVFEIFDIKNFEEAKKIAGNNSLGANQLNNLFQYAKLYGISEFLEFNIGIVRGLNYYTGIVFEAFDRQRKFRAIFGGGRYDNLLESFGGKKIPAVGFGFGDVVVLEVLKELKKNLPEKRKLDYVVSYSDVNLEDKAIKLCTSLRDKGKSVYLIPGETKMKKSLAMADKMNADYIDILDPIEMDQGKYIEKNLKERTQEVLDFTV